MKKGLPKVTVLMSVFNSEKYVAQAIESVLNQTYSNFEFLIFEDCSSDSTLEIIQSYASRDSRIILIPNSINQGLTLNLVKGMDMAKGKYLARMDADDICLPSRFQKQVEYLEQNTEISLLGSSVIFFDDHGYEFIGYQPLEHDEIKVELLLGYTMMHPSVMMRVENFRKYNLNYDPSFRYSQDFDLWVRAIRKLKFANLSEPLIKMREHPNKISRELKPQQKLLSDKIRESQYSKLNLQFSVIEKKVLDDNSTGISITNNQDFNTLEKCFLKIIEQNLMVQEYNHKLLLFKIQNNIRHQYYECLIKKNNAGLSIWKSSFNLVSTSSFYLQIKIIIRSVFTYIN